MYRAITRFADLQDGSRVYEAGDDYPRPGFSVSEARLAELAGSDNRAGKPLIKAVEGAYKAADPADDKIPVEPMKPAEKGRKSRKKG